MAIIFHLSWSRNSLVLPELELFLLLCVCLVLVAQSCLTSVRGVLQVRMLEGVALSREDFPDPWIELGSSALQADSLPSELSEKLIFLIISFQNSLLFSPINSQ